MTNISVLMPVYNGMPYIQEAVESVLAQHHIDWELIISDNGSTDATRDYLDTLDDPRIRVYKQDTNLGIYGNLNFLLEQIDAPIAKILCHDDMLLPNALERVVKFMNSRPECAISRCWARGDRGRYGVNNRYYLEGELPTHLVPAAAFLAYATFGNPVGNLSQAAFRPALLLNTGGFDQSLSYAGDREAWARCVARYGLDLHNEELIFERIHPKQSRVLLDCKNESISQTNRILEDWITKVDADNIDIMKRHWVIHFLSPRLPRAIRQFFAGNIKLGWQSLCDLPLGISPWNVIAAYPFFKFNLPPARATLQQLFNRILEINEVGS